MGDGAGRQTGCCCVPTPAPNIRVTSSPIAGRLLRCQRTPLRVCTLGVDCRSFLLRCGTEGSNPSPSSAESRANLTSSPADKRHPAAGPGCRRPSPCPAVQMITTAPYSAIPQQKGRSASRSVLKRESHGHGSGSVLAAPEPTPQFLLNACCLWCARTFTPRKTGGSAQRFCCTAHRQQFWIAARRWTIRAIEAGLLSVDCLKASHTSVHAA